MKIHFVTGKGGVGKTSVAAARAMGLSQAGRRVLFVELREESSLEAIWMNSQESRGGRKFSDSGPLDSKPRPCATGFSVTLLTGEACLREYAKHLIRIEALVHLIFANRVTQTLIATAPGLSEVAILGKITSGPPRNVGPALPFDDIVVDAHSTGHFLSFFDAVKGLSRSVSKGPMANETKAIMGVLCDPSICTYTLVSIAEPLAAQETLEFIPQLFAWTKVPIEVSINKFIDIPQISSDRPAPDSAFGRSLSAKNQNQIALLKEVSGVASLASMIRGVYCSPFVFEVDPWNSLVRLSQEIARAKTGDVRGDQR